jgi:hypothetical protein
MRNKGKREIGRKLKKNLPPDQATAAPLCRHTAQKVNTKEVGRVAAQVVRYWLLVAVLTVQFVPHRKHTPSP